MLDIGYVGVQHLQGSIPRRFPLGADIPAAVELGGVPATNIGELSLPLVPPYVVSLPRPLLVLPPLPDVVFRSMHQGSYRQMSVSRPGVQNFAGSVFQGKRNDVFRRGLASY